MARWARDHVALGAGVALCVEISCPPYPTTTIFYHFRSNSPGELHLFFRCSNGMPAVHLLPTTQGNMQIWSNVCVSVVIFIVLLFFEGMGREFRCINRGVEFIVFKDSRFGIIGKYRGVILGVELTVGS